MKATQAQALQVSRWWKKYQSRYRRNVHRLFFRRPFWINSGVPLVSFTFDDFPRSALQMGGAILKSAGLAGTYYLSCGLMGLRAPTGTMFLPEDLRALLDQGHELGCHTFDHCHSWQTEPAKFEHSVVENRLALNRFLPGASFRTLSYPISPPRPLTKQVVAKYFACCRGGGQTLNIGATDLNYLCAFFLEQSREEPEVVKNLIDQNRRAGGWLIFATHDVCSDPSPFGCTPGFLEDIVDYALNSGARILPVTQAYEALRCRYSS